MYQMDQTQMQQSFISLSNRSSADQTDCPMPAQVKFDQYARQIFCNRILTKNNTKKKIISEQLPKGQGNH